nr:MAG TPA: growth factor-like protein [Caudoviricetes sp.]
METQLKFGCDDCLCRDCLENCNENSDGCCYTCCKDSDECKPICRCPFGWYHDN